MTDKDNSQEDSDGYGKQGFEHGYGVIAVDFDATITNYEGWQGPGVFGSLMPGAKEALDRLVLKGYTIIINTTRGVDISAVREYLDGQNVPYHHINVNSPNAPTNVSDRKVLADVYIDDRALRFDGRWEGMVEKVEGFMPWYKRENRRPSLDLAVAGYHVDQISLYVLDIDKTREEYATLGHDKWVIDTVKAQVKMIGSHTGHTKEGNEFTVALAFNYTIFPCEFELIQVLEGRTIQIPAFYGQPGLSHYGYHVNNIDRAIKAFERCGYPLMTHVHTLSHEGCPHTYEYAFMNTQQLGFISKLIWRAQG